MAVYQSEQRLTYKNIKEWVLEDYFDFSRDTGVREHGGHDQVLGRLCLEFEDGFERPVENLMLKVILLVISCGLHIEWEVGVQKTIIALIAEHGLDALLADLPQEEAETFRHDLKILKLI